MSDQGISSKELKADLFRAIEGNEGESIYRSIQTAGDRLRYANIRLLDIQQVIEEKITPNFEKWQQTFYVVEPKGVFNNSQWEIRMLATEAVQHLHSVFDPLARAVYYFTVPETTRKLASRDISFFAVRQCIDVDMRYQTHLSAIASDDNFFHLAALSNLAKHSHIVRPSFVHWSADGLPPDAESAMVFQPCQGINWLNKARQLPIETEFPSTPISKLLKEEIHRVIPLFNQIVGLIRSDLDMRLKAEKL